MASVELKNINKIYDGNVHAVKDFNLEINHGEFVVFVGPSGCGKTTTLRMVAGLEDITSGDLLIDGKRVNDVQASQRDIAMVFQSYALYPHLSVYDNIAFGLSVRKVPKSEIREKVMEVSKFLELTDLLWRKPKALSGGQKQRVAMGRAIVREPKVFLLDEPLSNLDAKLRVQMRAEIAKLHKRLEATIIYVTHDQVEAMTLGDKIVVMKDGVIMQADTPENLYNKPANTFVAGFIGTPAMNFVPGDIFSSIFPDAFSEVIPKTTPDIVPDAVPKTASGAASEINAQNAIIGVRAEDIHIGHGDITANVESKEMHGADTFVNLSVSGQNLVAGNDTSSGLLNLVARADTSLASRMSGQVPITINKEKIHIFDGRTLMRR